MKPSILIYGGVHDDPGSRRKFLNELAKQRVAPNFFAVEWEQSVFHCFAAQRPLIEKGLESRWDFLTHDDRAELSRALAWEGDAYKSQFPGIDQLWLEMGYQAQKIKSRLDADNYPELCARGLLERLCDPCGPTIEDPPPEPRSKQELVDRVWIKTWEDRDSVPGGFQRDERWDTAISDRASDLNDGWIAVVVGWQHADSKENGRLRSLLSSRGFTVESVYLGP